MTQDKKETYELLLKQAELLLSAECNPLASLSNISALLRQGLPNSVFTGFYLFDGNELVLGPFQGGVSCARIKLGSGVCGEVAQSQVTMIVPDVRQHENYIACDSKARSEIVVPIVVANQLIGVLDLDSEMVSDYDEIDRYYLEKLVNLLVTNTEWNWEMFGVKS